jgi:hypothetical protein
MSNPHPKSVNLPAAVPTLPPVVPLPPTSEMRSPTYNAALALDARMGRPTSIRAIGLATYRASLSASTPKAPRTNQA